MSGLQYIYFIILKSDGMLTTDFLFRSITVFKTTCLKTRLSDFCHKSILLFSFLNSLKPFRLEISGILHPLCFPLVNWVILIYPSFYLIPLFHSLSSYLSPKGWADAQLVNIRTDYNRSSEKTWILPKKLKNSIPRGLHKICSGNFWGKHKEL